MYDGGSDGKKENTTTKKDRPGAPVVVVVSSLPRGVRRHQAREASAGRRAQEAARQTGERRFILLAFPLGLPSIADSWSGRRYSEFSRDCSPCVDRVVVIQAVTVETYLLSSGYLARQGENADDSSSSSYCQAPSTVRGEI